MCYFCPAWYFDPLALDLLNTVIVTPPLLARALKIQYIHTGHLIKFDRLDPQQFGFHARGNILPIFLIIGLLIDCYMYVYYCIFMNLISLG